MGKSRDRKLKRALAVAFYRPKMNELSFNEWGVAIDKVYSDSNCTRKAFVIEDGRVLKNKDWSAEMWMGKYGLAKVVDPKNDYIYYTFVDQDGNLAQTKFSTYDKKAWARGKVVLKETGSSQVFLWDEDGLQEEFKVKGLPIEEKVKLYAGYRTHELNVFGGRKLVRLQTADNSFVVLDNDDFKVLPFKFDTIELSCNSKHFYTKDGDVEQGIIAVIDNEPKWLFGVTDDMAKKIERNYAEFLNLPDDLYGNRDVVANHLTLAMQSLRNDIANTQNKDIHELKESVEIFVAQASESIKEGIKRYKEQQDFDFEAGRTRAKLDKDTGEFENHVLKVYDEKIKE